MTIPSLKSGVEPKALGKLLDFDLEVGAGAAVEEVRLFRFGGWCAATDRVEVGSQARTVAAAIVAEKVVGEQRGGVVEIVRGLGGDLSLPVPVGKAHQLWGSDETQCPAIGSAPPLEQVVVHRGVEVLQ